MSDSQWVFDVTGEAFQDQVVDRSHHVPIVLDFWAPWCGPCRTLGPRLEQLAHERNGRFVLAKVNTDDQPALANAFQIEGIPAVFAVRDGQIVDRFVGLLPDAELVQFIDKLTGPRESSPLEMARDLENRDPAAAVHAYRSLFSEAPDDPAARVGLARVLLNTQGNEVEAASLLAPIDSGENLDEADRLRAIIRIREISHGDAELAEAQKAAHDADASSKLRLGQILAARGDYHSALEQLLHAAELDRDLGRGPVREVMVTIFTIIGVRSPEADDFRDRLRNILY